MLQETFQELQKKFQHFKKLLIVVNKFQPKVHILNSKLIQLASPYIDLIKKNLKFLNYTLIDFKFVKQFLQKRIGVRRKVK